MSAFIGFLAAMLISISLIAIVATALAALSVVRSTLRANSRDRALRIDLEQALDEILNTAANGTRIL
ncbi:MAG: hypothetical protein HKL86_03515 [Acidimicrobiaceae bacterium]|nr:hypothetical protein [Acidimicrobiaceae bacterium]